MDDKLQDLPDGSIARLVRQNFHLKYVIPEAILRLSKNPITGNHYEGELINSINAIDNDFWESNLNLCKELKELLEKIETKEINLPQDFEWCMEEEEQDFYENVRNVISILKCLCHLEEYMDNRIEEIIQLLDAVATEIIVPLRRKVINEAAFSELFKLMDELQSLLYNEKNVEKEIVALLFLIYTQIDTQAKYVTEDEKKIFMTYLRKMRVGIREIFGKALENE